MNDISKANALPRDITFFVGPVAAPENIRQVYLKAIQAREAGNPELLDKFIDLQINTLKQMAEGGDLPLKQLLESLVDDEIVTIRHSSPRVS